MIWKRKKVLIIQLGERWTVKKAEKSYEKYNFHNWEDQKLDQKRLDSKYYQNICLKTMPSKNEQVTRQKISDTSSVLITECSDTVKWGNYIAEL